MRYDDRDDTYDFKSWTRRDNRWRTIGEDMAPSLMRILNKNRTQKNGKYSLMLNAWEVETLHMILSVHIRFVLRSSSDDFQDCEWEEFKTQESKMKGRLLETITKQTKDYIGKPPRRPILFCDNKMKWISRKYDLEGMYWEEARDTWIPELSISFGQAISALKKSWLVFKLDRQKGEDRVFYYANQINQIQKALGIDTTEFDL